MRIVAGRFRGMALAAPKSNDIRPTSDRVRESIFNILAHGIEGAEIEGARVLDLFAGTGALGLEALSRGAAYVHFVEDNSTARGLIRQNIETVGAMGETKIYRRDATKLGGRGNLRPFDLIFADPPYGKRLAEPALASALADGWAAPGAIAVVEEHADAEFAPPPGFSLLDRRVYGDTAVFFLTYTPQAAAG
ncbi:MULTISPECIES: 16S rRNA (guanine(966)-N(2))-methyltransferase RsmD [Rhodomicrobium]|uniref:16S rRNA (guanine(966)-N(2))-methyltransferase RsmD n=1 Tax=Rhodomicrobium TaxID=1068 RepID=UPI000B4B0ECB|nr:MULTISPECIES: 16S rRNA (guanine(966)-N(2))-methyltransferase RsmD [Rhodomicrobium]